ncbi:hypothetical protein V2I01_13795 [Micromonospora sp. BRA006-A]|nr:hypothetical protein [Micromonospora sp. BRA006-A]
MVGVVDRLQKRAEINPCAEGEIGVEYDYGDVVALVGLCGTVEVQVESVRRASHQPCVARALAGLNRVSHDDGGSAVGRVKHAADGVVQRGLGVETTARRVGEPVDKAVEETAKAVDRVPLLDGSR